LDLTPDGAPYPSENNSVRPVRAADGRRLVLKEGDLAHEQQALRCLNRSVRVVDEAPGVLLLERLDGPTWAEAWTPGRDRYDTWRFGRFLRHFHSERTAELPDPFRRCDPLREAASLPGDLRAAALEVFLTAPRPWVVLHGDLHHFNLVRHRGRTVAIDPHGWLGPRVAEVGAFLGNPMPRAGVELMPERVRVLAAELAVPAVEVARWAFAHATLCWSWSLEDGDPEAPYWSGLARYWFEKGIAATAELSSP